MKWLVINIEAFSPKGLKQEKTVSFEDLPWVARKFLSVFPQPFIVLDECFVAGTPVDVVDDNGIIFQKTIDSIFVGDKVLNAIGEDYVEATNRKEVEALVEVRAARNTSVCSENHSFFTLYGWKPAKDLRAGDYLVETTEAVHLLRKDVYPTVCLPKVAAFLRKKLLGLLANGAAEYTRGGLYCAKTRRQWQGYTTSCAVSLTRACTRLAARIRCVLGKEEAGIPDGLQAGYCPSCPNDCDSGRWPKPPREKTIIRQEKGYYDGLVRVESVTVLEQGNPELDKYRSVEGRIHCYDIKAKRHPSFSVNGILVHNCSKIKTNTPMKEADKSTRTRLIKLFNKFGNRCIMTGTLMSKSPLNVVDPFNFLKEGYFPENMWALAETYCVMETIRVGRGRRVLISQKDYEAIRIRLKNAFIRGGEMQLEAAKESIFKQFAIDYAKQEHIIRHRKYTPFINEKELLRRIAPDTLFVRREDVFDIRFDKFVKEPIMRPVKLSGNAKRIANEFVELGFTNNFVLGKAPALELLTRLQDICNGFEPVKDDAGKVSYRPLSENPKLDELISLMEEIGIGKNQMVVWASRKNLLNACAERFEKEGISFVRYDGDASNSLKEEAEKKFLSREVSVFLANQSSGAYGLNCLAQCSYAVYMCVDGSVEKYHQSQHRILRGQLTAPKFSYAIYAGGTVEERQWTSLKVGKELIEVDNRKEKFIFV
jgi:hypothetical protein